MSAWWKKIRDTLYFLLLEYKSPRQLAFAVALGTYVGASPLWGLHTALAVGLAFLFRLNKPAVVIASYFICLPWFLPFLIFGSLEIGSLLLYGHPAPLALSQVKIMLKDPDWHQILNVYLEPYFLGSFLVALIPAFCFYLITLLITRGTGVDEPPAFESAGNLCENQDDEKPPPA